MRGRSGEIFTLCFVPILASSDLSVQGASTARLDRLLNKAGAYCEKLKSMALHFVCLEKVKETTYELSRSRHRIGGLGRKEITIYSDLIPRGVVRKSYVYDYQMIKKGGEFAERRNLIEEDGKARDEKDVNLKTARLIPQFLVYGPVGFLSPSWQPHFQYEIIDFDRIDRRNVLVIRASPKEAMTENLSFGRLWVDENDGSVMRIEWEPRSIQNFTEKVESPMGTLQRDVVWKVIYGIVKNGIRFPSLQEVKEILQALRGRKHTKYEAEYKYTNYRFFTVETEVRFE